MCGESLSSTALIRLTIGSPPHVWGKPRMPSVVKSCSRITPTCVGKASSRLAITALLQDHPHMCGESSAVSGMLIMSLGSPPHVWGKLRNLRPDLGQVRITPTCVGKAGVTVHRFRLYEDHPHMCGESSGICQRKCEIGGSPPHVWGKLYSSSV